MGGLTQNMKDIVGVDEIEWLAGSRWILPTVKEAHPYFPHVLFVDEDARFAKNVAKIARRNRIHLVTCKSAWDLRHLVSQAPFDVAILDLGSGELAKNQVGHFLEEHVPILIVGQSESTKALEKNFPKVIHRVVDKNAGPRAVLEEALALVGARHLLEAPQLVEKSASLKLSELPHSLWLFVLATLIALAFLWVASHNSKLPETQVPNVTAPIARPPNPSFSKPQEIAPMRKPSSNSIKRQQLRQPGRVIPMLKDPKNIYRWDQLPVSPNVQSG